MFFCAFTEDENLSQVEDEMEIPPVFEYNPKHDQVETDAREVEQSPTTEEPAPPAPVAAHDAVYRTERRYMPAGDEEPPVPVEVQPVAPETQAETAQGESIISHSCYFAHFI